MVRKILSFAIAATSLAGCESTQVRDELPRPPFSEADEELFQSREDLYLAPASKRKISELYDPVERVEGAPGTEPLEFVGPRSLSAEAIDAALKYVDQRNTSALLIWTDEGLELERYFNGSSQDKPLVSKAMAKPIAAMMVGRAIAMGAIETVDQLVADFVTEWQGDPRKSRITIRHLLEMRSGLLPQEFGPEAPQILRRAYLHPRHDSVLVYEYPLVAEPGERFEYSNANSELIALVIERATGQRFADFLSSELLAPIGAVGGEVWIDRPDGLAHSGCCLSIPAQSYLRLGILLSRGGNWGGKEIISADFVQDMMSGTKQNPHFGMGLWVAGPYVERRGYLHPSKQLGKVLHSEPYLDGNISLFDGNGHQVMYIMPSAKAVILRMGDFPGNGLEWDNSVLPNLLIADLVEHGAMAPPPRQNMRTRNED